MGGRGKSGWEGTEQVGVGRGGRGRSEWEGQEWVGGGRVDGSREGWEGSEQIGVGERWEWSHRHDTSAEWMHICLVHR